MAENNNRTARARDFIKAYVDLIQKRSNPDKDWIVPTGLNHLDDMLDDGFTGGQLVVIAARPAMGKTAFSLQIAENISKGKKIIFFSMEMGAIELIDRLVTRNTGISATFLKKGKTREEDFAKIGNYLLELRENKNFYINEDSTHTIKTIDTEVSGIIEQLRKEYPDEPLKVGAIIIDYLQLIKGLKSTQNRNEQIGEITRFFKELARRYNIPVILLSQLNRSLESRPNKRPLLSDLKESGSIEQDADIVIALYRPEVYYPEKEELKGIAEAIVLKNRSGQTGTSYMRFMGQYYSFESITVEEFVMKAKTEFNNSFGGKKSRSEKRRAQTDKLRRVAEDQY